MTVSKELIATIGQLIIGRIPGTALNGESKSALRDGIMGGVTLFKDNAESLSQLLTLIDELNGTAKNKLLLAVDQEGGPVQRFDEVITPLPSAMALGALASAQFAALTTTAYVETIAQISARQLKLLGINCVFAPVLDVATNPLNPVIGTRSFGSDPYLVANLGMAFAQAYAKQGLLAVGKHFPGHGDTLEDSHHKLAISYAKHDRLTEIELIPFIECVPYLPAIMTGHVWLPEFEREPLPATLSSFFITRLLRENLGFEGLVISDCLRMKAIADNASLGEAAVKAILAGVDQVLVCGSLPEIHLVHKSLCDAAESGVIPEERILEALARRQKFLERPAESGCPSASGQQAERIVELELLIKEDNKIALDIAVSASALIRGNLPNILKTSGDWIVVAPNHKRYQLPVVSYLLAVPMPAHLEEKRYTLNPDAQEIADLAAYCAGKNCIFLTYKALIHKGQLELGAVLADQCAYKLAVATDIPYDLTELPQWPNALALFDPSDLAAHALALVLTGEGTPAGVCPVDLTSNSHSNTVRQDLNAGTLAGT